MNHESYEVTVVLWRVAWTCQHTAQLHLARTPSAYSINNVTYSISAMFSFLAPKEPANFYQPSH